jgi:hypothetical protein
MIRLQFPYALVVCAGLADADHVYIDGLSCSTSGLGAVLVCLIQRATG